MPLAGEVLDTRACAGVVDYEPSELVVTARAGTPLAELEALLAGRGSACRSSRRIRRGRHRGRHGGGGLSGPARASAGAVRDFVLGRRSSTAAPNACASAGRS